MRRSRAAIRPNVETSSSTTGYQQDDRLLKNKRERRKERIRKTKGKTIFSIIAICMALVPFATIMIIIFIPNINHDASKEDEIEPLSLLSSQLRKNNDDLNQIVTVGVENNNNKIMKDLKDTGLNNNNNNEIEEEEEEEEQSNSNSGTDKIVISGIIQDTSKISDLVWSFLIEMNCQYKTDIHILANRGTREAMLKRDSHHKKESNKCSSFQIIKENPNDIYGIDNNSNNKEGIIENRVDRISHLRNYHRELLSHQYYNHNNGGDDEVRQDWNDNNVMIIADFDLWKLPTVKKVLSIAKKLQDPEYPHDAICAAGITMANHKELWYYDMFATVLLPDTFVYPLSRRLIPHYYEGEDKQLVRSNKAHGSITQGDLMRHFVQQSQKSPTGAMSVKSCFGGFTMYRFQTFFHSECDYTLPQHEKKNIVAKKKNHESTLMRYAGAKDKRPCEHVVFHDCLKQLDSPKIDLALHPQLLTLWKRN